MATWMKTPDIMASFVHGSVWVGWGAVNVAATFRTPTVLVSPVSSNVCGRLSANVSECVYVCVFARALFRLCDWGDR